MNPITKYLNDIGKRPLLTKDEELSLARKASKKSLHGKTARDKLIESNLRLVVSIAKKYANKGMDVDDLVQEGNLGLMRAVKKYNPTYNLRFSTYATWWIRQAITRAIGEKSRTIALPMYVVEQIYKIKKVTRSLIYHFNRKPSIKEIAVCSQLEEAYIKNLMNYEFNQDCKSLEEEVPGANNVQLKDIIEDDEEKGTTQVSELNMNNKFIESLLDNLNDHEQDFVKMYFGLYETEAFSIHKLASWYGITVAEVRDNLMRILRKLKNMVK